MMTRVPMEKSPVVKQETDAKKSSISDYQTEKCGSLIEKSLV